MLSPERHTLIAHTHTHTTHTHAHTHSHTHKHYTHPTPPHAPNPSPSPLTLSPNPQRALCLLHSRASVLSWCVPCCWRVLPACAAGWMDGSALCGSIRRFLGGGTSAAGQRCRRECCHLGMCTSMGGNGGGGSWGEREEICFWGFVLLVCVIWGRRNCGGTSA